MYHFNEQVEFKISSKLIQASKGYIDNNSYNSHITAVELV